MKTNLSSALLKEFLSYVGIPPVLLTAKNNYVRLFAWSNGVMFRAEYPSTVKEDGEFTLAPNVLNILKNVHRDAYIDLETTDNGIKVKADSIRLNAPEFKEQIFWPDDDPDITYKAIVLPWMKIISNNRARKDFGSPVLEGMYFKDGVIAATDRYRASTYADAELVTDGKGYIIPKEGLFFLSKVTPKDEVKFDFGAKRVTITTPKVVATMPMMTGSFPNVSAVPTNMSNELTVNAQELTVLLNQAAVIREGNDPPWVHLETENGFMKISTTDGEIVFEAKVGVTVQGDELSVRVNTNFMLDYFGNVDGDVFIEYNAADSPLLIHQKDNLHQFIMPIGA